MRQWRRWSAEGYRSIVGHFDMFFNGSLCTIGVSFTYNLAPPEAMIVVNATSSLSCVLATCRKSYSATTVVLV